MAALTKCVDCRFWNGADRRAGTCRRYAPAAGDRPFQSARWPETSTNDACGEGEPKRAETSQPCPNCRNCRYWDRPGIGIDPASRGDHLQAWWQDAGWCRRYAPRPGIEIGEHAFWRATHATDFCFEAAPRRDSTEKMGSEPSRLATKSLDAGH